MAWVTPGPISRGEGDEKPDLSVDKSGRGRPPVTPEACLRHDGGRDSRPPRPPAPGLETKEEICAPLALRPGTPGDGPAGCPLDTRLVGPRLAGPARFGRRDKRITASHKRSSGRAVSSVSEFS